MSERESAIAVEGHNVTLAYGRHSVLRDASFALPTGAVTSLVGPNGAGKSSLLNAIVGLLPVESGTLTVAGGVPTDMRRRVAYVMQSAKVNDQLPVTIRNARRLWSDDR
jgi:ABC-type Mn2+/Zn2+ transport system ATPase subunit